MNDIRGLAEVHLQGEEPALILEGLCGRVRFEPSGAQLTAYGGLAAWSAFVRHLGLVEDLAVRYPVARTSPNATPVADVLHGFLVNCLLAGRRFAHVRLVQDDAVVAELLGMKRPRVCGEDALPRLLRPLGRTQARAWMAQTERELYGALPGHFIADWDATVVVRYGHQEEAKPGYNPHQPGRPSHHPLLCTVAGTRLCLHLHWRPGDEVSAAEWVEAMERVWSHPTVRERLWLNRGDCAFGQEKILAWHEAEGVPRPKCLFKLRLTANVRRALAQVPWPLWEGQPQQGAEIYAEARVQLQGWSRARRVIFVRTLKPLNPSPQDEFWALPEDEVQAYVTTMSEDELSPAQAVLLYRKRADAENVFDELKNQWGFAGFCSQRAVVSEGAARLCLLAYNLWSLFVHLLRGERDHREAIRSRAEFLLLPAQLTVSGRQRTLKVGVSPPLWQALRAAWERLRRWLGRTAPQLTLQSDWFRWTERFDPLPAPT